MKENYQKKFLDKTTQSKITEVTVSEFMSSHYIALKPNYTLKSTIETFRVHHISGAPVIDFEGKIQGVISEYDLLIQAASKNLNSVIDFKLNVIAVYPETTLKEVLVMLFKNKLKWMPVINKENYLKGVVSRIDVLNFIATNENQ